MYVERRKSKSNAEINVKMDTDDVEKLCCLCVFVFMFLSVCNLHGCILYNVRRFVCGWSMRPESSNIRRKRTNLFRYYVFGLMMAMIMTTQ